MRVEQRRVRGRDKEFRHLVFHKRNGTPPKIIKMERLFTEAQAEIFRHAAARKVMVPR